MGYRKGELMNTSRVRGRKLQLVERTRSECSRLKPNHQRQRALALGVFMQEQEEKSMFIELLGDIMERPEPSCNCPVARALVPPTIRISCGTRSMMSGDTPTIRVLDFLLTFSDFDYSLTVIAKNSGVAWSTIHTFFPELVRQGVVKETRQIGRAKLYKLNHENLISQNFVQIYNQLLKQSIAEATVKEVVRIQQK